MSRLFTSSLEDGVGAEWDVAVGTVSTSTTRHGTYKGDDNANTSFKATWKANATEFYAGFGVYWTGFGSISRRFAVFESPAGNAQVSLAVDGSGHIRAGRGDLYQFGGGTELGVGSTTTLTSGQYYFIEVHVVIDSSSGVFEVKIDGTTELNLTSQNTKGDSGSAVCGRINLGPDGFSTQHYFDDVYVNDAAGGYEGTSFDGTAPTPVAYVDEVAADTPVGFWLLDEPSGTTAADSSGNGYDGTYQNSPTLGGSGPINGHTSVNISGASSNYVQVATQAALHVASGSNPWTLEAWFKGGTGLGDFGGPAILTAGYDGSNVDYTLGFWNGTGVDNKPSVAFYNGSWKVAHASSPALDDATWHHIVGTFDGSNFRLYLDGVLILGPSGAGGTPNTTTQDLYIGRRWDGGQIVTGDYAAVAIYDSELSAARIVAHYIAADVEEPEPGIDADIAQTLPSITQAATADLPPQGDIAQTLPAATQAAEGDVINEAEAAQTLGAVTQDAEVDVDVIHAEVAQTLGVVTQDAEAEPVWPEITAEIAGTLSRIHTRARAQGFEAGGGGIPVAADFSTDIQGPNGGAAVVSGAPFQAARITWTVDGPGAAEIDLTPAQLTDDWQPGTHRVAINLGGSPVFAGYLTRLERSGAPAHETYKASAIGLGSILDWRLVRHVFGITDTMDEIVFSLLDEAQTQYNGDMGFTEGAVVGTLPTRTRSYCFGVVIGDAIRELASAGRGFDWEVDPSGALNIWAGSRGSHTGFSVAEEDVNDWQVELDTSDLVTTVSAIGDEQEVWGPKHRMVRSGLAPTYGRHEVGIQVDSTDPDDLIDAAESELAARGGATLRLKTMWIDGRGPWSWGDVWLQDIVTASLPAIFGGAQDMRCVEVSISLDPGLYRFVEYTFEALVADITTGDPDGGES